MGMIFFHFRLTNYMPNGDIFVLSDQQGETRANILVGIQVPRTEMDEFHERANRLGYEYKVVNDDDDFQLLMH